MITNRMKMLEQEKGKPIREIIQHAFDQCDTQSEAADLLGISQSTLSLWLLRLGYRQKTKIVLEKIQHS